WIPVVPGVAQQAAIGAQEGEVHAPGVHSQSVDAAMLRGTTPKRGEHLAVQPQDVPVQGVQQAHRAVGKAVHDFQGELSAVEAAEHSPAALGTEVEGKQFLGSWHKRIIRLEDSGFRVVWWLRRWRWLRFSSG